MSFSSVEDPEHGPDLHLSVEVLQRYSKLEPISFDLCSERESADPPPARTAAPRVHKLDKRLDPAVVAELVAAYEAGTSATQLTKQYNVGKGSVLRLLHEAGVAIRQPRVMGQAEIDQAVQLYESGQSLQRVGDHLGWNHKTIYRQLKKRGVTMRSPNDWQY